MFGPRITQVFRSRWHALWWAAGILLTAYCSVPSTDETRQAAPAPHSPAAKHVNPWARDAK
ncbi:MAG: hypothetical protein IT550_10705 [Novosphingobium sp.]|jgi:hypothetical protein|nr:hypothetical protein [Novosphingobium sp.]